MKKVYTYLAALAAAALVVFSCQPLPEDLSHVDEIVKAPAVTISVSEITDYTATVTIAPDGAANYYAYVVDKSNSADELNPEKLYANKYSSVANGLVKYATEASKTVELEDLDPNSVYQVYAVAGSTTGVVGTISVASFTTTDKGTPAPTGISKKDNVLQVKFSEAVVYKSDKPATAYYYALNAAIIDKSDKDNPVLVDNGCVGEANVSVAVSGSVATFTVTLDGTNPLPDGAYFTVGYPAGAFEDVVGNPAPARTHVTGLTSSATLGFGGFYNRMPTKAFELEYDEEQELTGPEDDAFFYAIPEGVQFYGLTKNAKATMTVNSESASKTTTSVYTLTPSKEWGYIPVLGSLVLLYPNDIAISGGDTLSLEIAAGSAEDIYGNTNAALKQDLLYIYGYKLEDIYGTYWNSGKTIFTSKDDENPWSFTIEESDDPEKGNVMITQYYGFDGLSIYGTFDGDMGTFTFPIHYSAVYLGGFVYDEYYLDFSAWSYNSTKDAPNMTLYMTELGYFTGGNDYPGYVYDIYSLPESGDPDDIDWDNDYVGYNYNMFTPVFERMDEQVDDEEPVAASMMVRSSLWTPSKATKGQKESVVFPKLK